MPLDNSTSDAARTANRERQFRVWSAFGDTIIVEGTEPVWEEPGKQAELLAEIEAVDYETACALWNDECAKASPQGAGSIKTAIQSDVT